VTTCSITPPSPRGPNLKIHSPENHRSSTIIRRKPTQLLPSQSTGVLISP